MAMKREYRGANIIQKDRQFTVILWEMWINRLSFFPRISQTTWGVSFLQSMPVAGICLSVTIR